GLPGGTSFARFAPRRWLDHSTPLATLAGQPQPYRICAPPASLSQLPGNFCWTAADLCSQRRPRGRFPTRPRRDSPREVEHVTPPLALHYPPDALHADGALCGKPTELEAGPQLRLLQGGRPVCPGCGRQAAPELAALVGLASTAERVGRI